MQMAEADSSNPTASTKDYPDSNRKQSVAACYGSQMTDKKTPENMTIEI